MLQLLSVFPLAVLLQWAISMETNLTRAQGDFERRALRAWQFIILVIVFLVVALI